ncbi:MAG: hypothetical protein WC635_17970 [Bacteriovorax sp.]|jgi:Na+-transporting NADH:ubiquinone oxidoreductase subunit NqrF
MNKSITVLGKASNRTVKVIPVPAIFPEELSLMEFLISYGITVASSCGGVGSCQKCMVNTTLLSCQITLKVFIQTNPQLQVEISYL